MPAKRGLGRGLGGLIRDGMEAKPIEERAGPGIQKVAIEKIQRGKWQPRNNFDSDALRELAESIKEHGVLQPLLVRAEGDGYELIAGERRFRAAGEAGLMEVPVTIMDVTGADALQLALVENLQREDLNVIEEAEGYQQLADDFDMSQEDIAKRVGKARATVTNAIRLLSLPSDIKQAVVGGQLSAGHAKAIAGLDVAEEQLLYARRSIKENLSVRNLEKLIQKATRAPRKPRATRNDLPKDHIAYLSDKLHRHFGTGVRITPCRTYANGKKAKGALEIDFYSNDDLDRILSLLGVAAE